MTGFFERLQQETGIHFTIEHSRNGRGRPLTSLVGFKRLQGLPFAKRMTAEGDLLYTADHMAFLTIASRAIIRWFEEKEKALEEESESSTAARPHPADQSPVAPLPGLRIDHFLAGESLAPLDLYPVPPADPAAGTARNLPDAEVRP